MDVSLNRLPINLSIVHAREWTEDDLTYTELISQEYSNCWFSAGIVSGHPVDTMYLQLGKKGKVTTQLLLRLDEMAAIAWLASGVLWSELLPKETE